MVKKRGPYLRNEPKPKKSGGAQHFIREWREWKDWTQEVLADKSGYSAASISGYERNEIDPSLEAVDALAKAMGITRGMLLDINPTDDPSLWAGYARATEKQRAEIVRFVDTLVGPPHRKN
jgi:transcriptional regulator with XRE-family HTH domain